MDIEQQRRQLQARLERIKDLYAWGDPTREQYRTERDALDCELARPAGYVSSLPAAWADADQEQRNQLASLIYVEVWVDGPRLLYVKPRPEVEPLFQVLAGAAQPTRHEGSELSTTIRSGDPDGSGVILSHYHLGRRHGLRSR
jgi:hypothetical protein